MDTIVSNCQDSEFKKNLHDKHGTNKIRNADFMSILHGQPIKEFTPPKFIIGDKVRISKNDLPLSKGYKHQFTEKFLRLLPLLAENLQLTP